MNEGPQPLRVRYVGTADRRILTQTDLSGEPGGDWRSLIWTQGSEIDYDYWLDLAGDNEARAREVLKLHQHEFQLTGVGSEEFWDNGDEGEEEFVIEAPAEETASDTEK
jgi:hypothetical protein